MNLEILREITQGFRGEQPERQATPAPRALRGDTPLSKASVARPDIAFAPLEKL